MILVVKTMTGWILALDLALDLALSLALGLGISKDDCFTARIIGSHPRIVSQNRESLSRVGSLSLPKDKGREPCEADVGWQNVPQTFRNS